MKAMKSMVTLSLTLVAMGIATMSAWCAASFRY
jgi:hypothetical protein